MTIDSRTNALIAARTALDKQAEHIIVMDVRALSSVTDFFILCTAGSARQIEAIKEHLEDVLEQRGCPVWHTEGVATSPLIVNRAPSTPQWVLMDFGDFVVHLLDQPTRAFYRLEELWADAPRVSIEPERLNSIEAQPERPPDVKDAGKPPSTFMEPPRM